MSLEDGFALLRLPVRGRRFFDPVALTIAETRGVKALMEAFSEAKVAGSQFNRLGTRRPPPDPRKTAFKNWLRVFFRDYAPAAAARGGEVSFVVGSR